MNGRPAARPRPWPPRLLLAAAWAGAATASATTAAPTATSPAPPPIAAPATSYAPPPFAAPATTFASPTARPAALTQCRSLGLSTCPVPFDADLPAPQDLLTWDQATRVIGFRNTYRLYAGDVFHTRGAPPFPLPPAAAPLPQLRYAMDGSSLTLADYQRRQSVTGLLILKDGHVAYEYYGAGNTPATLWTSRSVAKSVVSILIGMAIREKFIGAVTDPVTRYLPELVGSDWEGVTLQDLLQHVSGIAWNEHYADPTSDFAHLTRCEAAPAAYDCVLDLVRSRRRRPGVQPGAVWSYNTGGAWLVGRVLERATGMTIAHYLETRLWSRFAMEHDGVWEALVKNEVDMGGHGFNATLRDWGRFALFVANGGVLAHGGGDRAVAHAGTPDTSARLLPDDWLARSVAWTRAQGSVTPSAPNGQYGYQWWYGGVDPARGATNHAAATAQCTFWAEGIYGQAIAIDPTDHLIMVQWSAWKDAETPGTLYDEQALFFNAVARALAH